jgi:hypothetical protein
MPDLIRTSIDLPAKPADVYAYVAEPATGPMVSHARDVVDVLKNNEQVVGFKTKHGAVKYVTQAPPHLLESEYQQKGRAHATLFGSKRSATPGLVSRSMSISSRRVCAPSCRGLFRDCAPSCN